MKKIVLLPIVSGLVSLLLFGTFTCAPAPTPEPSPAPKPAPSPAPTPTPATKDIDLSELAEISNSYLLGGKREEDFARLINKNVRVTGTLGSDYASFGDFLLMAPNGSFLVISLDRYNAGFSDLFRNLNPPGMNEKTLFSLARGNIATIEGEFVGKWRMGPVSQAVGTIDCYKLTLSGKEYIRQR